MDSQKKSPDKIKELQNYKPSINIQYYRQRHKTKKELQANIPDEHRYSIFNKILANRIQTYNTNISCGYGFI